VGPAGVAGSAGAQGPIGPAGVSTVPCEADVVQGPQGRQEQLERGDPRAVLDRKAWWALLGQQGHLDQLDRPGPWDQLVWASLHG
jgi:hypothetical protein